MLLDADLLFTPFVLGNLTLSNRIVMAPMTRKFADNGLPGREMPDYYRRRVEGGTGLIISEGATINHRASNGYEGVPGFYGKEALARWKVIVDVIHEAGGKFAPQLWHVGAQRRPGTGPLPGEPGVGPMDIHEKDRRVVRRLEVSEISEVVSAFAKAARDAETIGCDAVEIHGAHGYIIDQFLWEKTNGRSDEYGGDLIKRLRFAVEVVKAVRSSVSETFPVIFRFSQWKITDYEARIAENKETLAIILQALSEAGVDIFHASTRQFQTPAFSGEPYSLAALTRKITGKPVIAVGGIGLDRPFCRDSAGQLVAASTSADLKPLILSLANNEFDLFAVGRALLADPDWGEKVRQGRLEELVPFSSELLTRVVN